MSQYRLAQETLISQHFSLGQSNARGWRRNDSRCPFCHDGKSGNSRSYFLFTESGIGFNCFNCSSKLKFTSNHHLKNLAMLISRQSHTSVARLELEFRKLELFPKEVTLATVLEDEDTGEEGTSGLSTLLDYKEVELPSYCFDVTMKATKINTRFRKSFTKYKDLALEFLKKKGLENHSRVQELKICVDGDWSGRLIMPIYFQKKLVGYGGRALYPSKMKYRYMEATDESNNLGDLIYNLDLMFDMGSSNQVFVTESIFDAWILDGISIFTKDLSPNQQKILELGNLTSKKLIFVLDNDKVKFTKMGESKAKANDAKGLTLGKKVLMLGNDNWSVSYPKFMGANKDIGESFSESGLLTTLDCIYSGMMSDSSELHLQSLARNKVTFKANRR